MLNVTNLVGFGVGSQPGGDGLGTWNPSDKGTVTLSGGNLSAVSAADTHGVRCTKTIPASGKWYWEVTPNIQGYGSALGIADSACQLNGIIGAAGLSRTFQFGSWFASFNSNVCHYGTNQNVTGGANWSGASNNVAGNVLMFAVDMDNGTMWVGMNGTWWNTSGTANPATNTDPRWSGLSGTTWYPLFAGYGSPTPVTVTANFGATAFSYTPPSGFGRL